MKVHILFKDPDGIYESIEEAVKESVESLTGLSDKERHAVLAQRSEEQHEKLSRWIEYGEYVGVAFDTDEMTARVLKVGEKP